MNRPLAFLAALLFAAIAVSSACIARTTPEAISFELKPSLQGGKLQLALWDRAGGRRSHLIGSSYEQRDIAGLDYRAFAASGRNPVSFALVREAGRVECAGTSSNSLATGTCRFSADPSFADYLAARGIARPNRDEAFGLTMTSASRALVEALANNRYPRPTIDELTALAALDVTGDYIASLSSHGFRPKDLDDLTQFAALDVTPE